MAHETRWIPMPGEEELKINGRRVLWCKEVGPHGATGEMAYLDLDRDMILTVAEHLQLTYPNTGEV